MKKKNQAEIRLSVGVFYRPKCKYWDACRTHSSTGPKLFIDHLMTYIRGWKLIATYVGHAACWFEYDYLNLGLAGITTSMLRYEPQLYKLCNHFILYLPFLDSCSIFHISDLILIFFYSLCFSRLLWNSFN